MTPGKAIDRILALRAGAAARMDAALATARVKAEQRERDAVERVLAKLTDEEAQLVERTLGLEDPGV